MAQNYIDVLKLDYLYSPKNTFKDTNVTTHLQEINGELTIPITLNERINFITGCYYEYSHASYNPGRKNEALYGTILKLGLNIKHGAKWSGTYMLLPKLSADFVKIGNSDIQFGGYALMQYTKSAKMNYKFGVYANTDLFGPFFVPLLGLYYLSPNEKFEVKGVLPFTFDVNYSFAKQFKLGSNLKGQVRTYHLNTPLATEQNRYLTKSTSELCIYVQYTVYKGLNFQLLCGRSFARSYRIYEEQVNWGLPLYYNGDKRVQLNTDFSNGWLFKFGLFYRIQI